MTDSKRWRCGFNGSAASIGCWPLAEDDGTGGDNTVLRANAESATQIQRRQSLAASMESTETNAQERRTKSGIIAGRGTNF